MATNQFVGTWKLLSSEMRTSGGNVHYPLGPDCIGRIMFDAALNFTAQLMQVGRPLFASGDMMQGTSEEIDAAYKGFVSYWGTYRSDDESGELTCTVEGSLFPNWVGGETRRYYEFEGERLTLRTEQFLMAGEETVGALVWERIN